MKVVIIAYACSPDHGSEEGVGFNYIIAISKFAECLVITSKENQKKLSEIKLKNVKWFFIEEDIIKKKLSNFWGIIGSSIFRFIIAYSYQRWQKKAEKKILQIIKSSKIDIIHKITYVGYRFPIYVANIPVINGPLGGIENMPISYFNFMSIKGKVIFFIRNILNSYQRKFSINLKNKYRKNNIHIISAHTNIQHLMHKYFKKDSIVLSEICYRNKITNLEKKDKIINVIWVGDIEPGKNLLPLLIAKKNLQKLKIEFNLKICGDGSEYNKLKKFVSINGLKNVKFFGKISRNETLNLMQSSNIYVSTSLKDLTSTSLVEAMISGCAIITTPLPGFKDAIGGAKSLYVNLESKKDLINSLSHNLSIYINDPLLREDYAQSTFKESIKFNHENVSKTLERFYKKILFTK